MKFPPTVKFPPIFRFLATPNPPETISAPEAVFDDSVVLLIVIAAEVVAPLPVTVFKVSDSAVK